VLDRGEKIELLVSRTEQLADQSYKFNSASRSLKYAYCFTNVKMWIALIIVVAVRKAVARSFPHSQFRLP